MRFKVDRDQLAEVVTWVARGVATRPVSSVLGGILLELEDQTLRLSSTDLDLSVEAQLLVGGTQEGRVLVPGRVFADVIRALPTGAVDFSAQSGSVEVRCGRVSHELHVLNAEEFPVPETFDDAPSGTVSAKQLATVIAQVARAASSDEARPVLTGVFVEAHADELVMAATDSYRLGMTTLAWSFPHGDATALVPARSLLEAARALPGDGEAQVAFSAQRISISTPFRRVTSRLLSGEFPRFRSLIPEGYENRCTVGRQDLLEALRQVAPYGQSGNPVRLTFRADEIQMDGQLQDVGRGAVTVDVKYADEELTMAFNAAFLSEGVAAFEDQEVLLDVRDPAKPALLHGRTSTSFTYLLMPVRISD